MKKPDRFERIVLAAMKKQDTPSSTCIWLNGPDIVKLLRREHRAVVRIVLREFKVWATTLPKGYASAPASRHERAKQCRDILDKLKKRAT